MLCFRWWHACWLHLRRVLMGLARSHKHIHKTPDSESIKKMYSPPKTSKGQDLSAIQNGKNIHWPGSSSQYIQTAHYHWAVSPLGIAGHQDQNLFQNEGIGLSRLPWEVYIEVAEVRRLPACRESNLFYLRGKLFWPNPKGKVLV